MSPCFEDTNPIRDDDDSTALDQSNEVLQNRQAFLVEAFQKALSLKSFSVLNPETYKLIYFSYGTKFNAETMVEDPIALSAAKSVSMYGRRVKLCITPCVGTIPKTRINDRELLDFSSAAVLLRNWMVHRQTRTCQDVLLRVIRKAWVILEDDAPVELDSDSDVFGEQ